MIAYYFPPFGGVPVQRTLKFVKCLREYEWEPVVLTVRDGYDHLQTNDPSLLSKIPDKVEVIRTRELSINARIVRFLRNIVPINSRKVNKSGRFANKIVKLRKLLYNSLWFPDEKNSWIPDTFFKGLRLLAKEDISVIYVSGYPWSAFLVGAILSRLRKVPLILDYRDAWTLFPRGFWDNRFQRFWEGLVLCQASKVIFVTNYMEKGYRERYPWIDRGKFVTITNGFNREDYERIETKKMKSDKFLITYTGTFNDNIPPLDIDRSPYYFLHALSKLLKEKDICEDIRVHFVGNYGKNNKDLIKELNLDNVVELTSSVSHDESIMYQMEAVLLLLVIYPCKQIVLDLTGKLFEYIGARKFILALVPDGEAKELIVKENLGMVVRPKDIESIKNAIYKLYVDWKQDKLKLEVDDSVFEKYEIKTLTKKLVEVIEETTN